MRAEVFLHCPRVLGKFGTDTETSWDCTFGLNTKGGMDDCEFEQYVMNSILPLYPNTRDRPGHRLLLKCDSGPGRLQIGLLAKLRFLGVYLRKYGRVEGVGVSGRGQTAGTADGPLMES